MAKVSIKSKRLNIVLMTDEELKAMIDNENREDLKTAYTEMLKGSRKNPNDRMWFAPWKIILRSENKQIGSVGFHGSVENHAVEIGYGIDNDYRNQGYATEAVDALLNVAFDEEDVYFVEAEAEESNEYSIRLLKKLGFYEDGRGKEGIRFTKDKEIEGDWAAVGMCIGMCLGVALGSLVFSSMAIGIGVGMCMGLGLGASKDEREKKLLKEYKEQRKKSE